MSDNIFKRSITHTETELLKRLDAQTTEAGVVNLLINTFYDEGRGEFAAAVRLKLVVLRGEAKDESTG